MSSTVDQSEELISPELYQSFSKIIYNETGITMRPGKESLVASRISKRLRALAMKSQKEYLSYLGKGTDKQELVEFVNAITTNVTSFYRESDHFEFLRTTVKEMYAKGQRKFRLWCAAASTGQEPYTLACTMLDAIGESHSDVMILATDICTDALSQAIAGVYESKLLLPLPEHLRLKYFRSQSSGKDAPQVASDELKDIIRFRTLNLVKRPFPMKGPLDFIFIRNVMIYFDQPTKSALVSEAVRLLRPGGYLILGHSEGMSGKDKDLIPIHPSVYRKPL